MSLSIPGRFQGTGNSIAFYGLLALSVVYALNIFSQLRLNTDAVVLLSVSLSVAEGHGFLNEGQQTVFPPGYPWMVSLLYTVGWSSPASLIVLNFCWLSAGVTSLAILSRTIFSFSRLDSLLLCALFLLNWIVVKHTSLPLTDIPFFGASMLSLMLMERARAAQSDRLSIAMFVCAWMLVLVSIGIRRPGIALCPALIVAIVTRPGWIMRYRRAHDWTKVLLLIALALSVIVSIFWVRTTSTLKDYPSVQSIGTVLEVLVKNIIYRATEFGEIALNIPSAKLPFPVVPIVTIVGSAAISLVGYGMWIRRRIDIVEIFFLSYMAIMFVWPYVDSRFLIPVLPFILIYGFFGIRNVKFRVVGRETSFAATIIAIHMLSGAVALGYNTRLSLSGERFPLLFGDGVRRATYCHHLKSCPVEDDAQIDSSTLRVLQAFSR